MVVDAVKEANNEATKSLNEIIKLDKRWRATEGVDDWIGEFLNNPCAKYLRKFRKSKGREENFSILRYSLWIGKGISWQSQIRPQTTGKEMKISLLNLLLMEKVLSSSTSHSLMKAPKHT